MKFKNVSLPHPFRDHKSDKHTQPYVGVMNFVSCSAIKADEQQELAGAAPVGVLPASAGIRNLRANFPRVTHPGDEVL